MTGSMEGKGLRWIGASVSGRAKSMNEDALSVFSCGACGSSIEALKGNKTLAERDMVFAVADGMGGANAGDIASQLLLQEMQSVIPETFKVAASGLYPDPLHHLEEVIQHANLAINQRASGDPSLEGMGATLAIAWFSPENLYFSNVGDSRIYRFHNDELTQLTVDHTHSWAALERGEINEREFRNHPRRSLLYEVMGGRSANVNPYLGACPYELGDRFLICSDGVIDGLWDKHIHAILSEQSTLESACAVTLEKVAEMDGRDDTTLILIEVF